ncbi:MAG: deoxyribonuclease IV [Candidatus Hodarchaeota archaeon]
MVRVGFHVSILGSVDRAVDRAVACRCDTFQIFSRNPRAWKSEDLTADEIRSFIEKLQSTRIYPPINHMPYLPNLASPRDNVHHLSLETLIAELKRSNLLRIPYLVTHLGSHLGVGEELGFRRIIFTLNKSLSEVDGPVMILLETTAGTKNSMGGRFEDIKNILNNIELEERIGVCFDTSHVFAAGYDIRSEKGLDETLRHFDKTIGLHKLKVIHLNDSKGALGSHIDRHEHIGLGYIGDEGFENILHNKIFRRLPLILETPIDLRRNDFENIMKVRELAT